MKGIYEIEVYNKVVHYFLTIRRNITVIRGNSATGKSQLIRLLSEYNARKNSSGVTVKCEVQCTVLTEEDWQERINLYKGRIIFIDEGNSFVNTREFATAIKYSDNYFVIISRENLFDLPYSIKEIYGMKETGKYINAKQVYNEMYEMYPDDRDIIENPDKIITEDSESGFQFFSKTAQYSTCESAGGKGNIISKCMSSSYDENVIAIVDGAAFGPDMENIMDWMAYHKNCYLYAPESFEFLILKSGVIECKKDMIINTSNYADSKEYFSWERFYTALLVQLTQNTNYQYKKSDLDEYYFTSGNTQKVKSILPFKY